MHSHFGESFASMGTLPQRLMLAHDRKRRQCVLSEAIRQQPVSRLVQPRVSDRTRPVTTRPSSLRSLYFDHRAGLCLCRKARASSRSNGRVARQTALKYPIAACIVRPFPWMASRYARSSYVRVPQPAKRALLRARNALFDPELIGGRSSRSTDIFALAARAWCSAVAPRNAGT
jgi:hypothetical protein